MIIKKKKENCLVMSQHILVRFIFFTCNAIWKFLQGDGIYWICGVGSLAWDSVGGDEISAFELAVL